MILTTMSNAFETAEVIVDDYKHGMIVYGAPWKSSLLNTRTHVAVSCQVGIDDIHMTHTCTHLNARTRTHTHTHTHTNLITGKLVNPEMSEDLIDFLSNQPGNNAANHTIFVMITSCMIIGYLWLMILLCCVYMTLYYVHCFVYCLYELMTESSF